MVWCVVVDCAICDGNVGRDTLRRHLGTGGFDRFFFYPSLSDFLAILTEILQ